VFTSTFKPIIDTTGCGDCFTGALVVTLLMLRNYFGIEGNLLMKEALK